MAFFDFVVNLSQATTKLLQVLCKSAVQLARNRTPKISKSISGVQSFTSHNHTPMSRMSDFGGPNEEPKPTVLLFGVQHHMITELALATALVPLHMVTDFRTVTRNVQDVYTFLS